MRQNDSDENRPSRRRTVHQRLPGNRCASSALRTPPAGLKPTVFSTPISRITSIMMRALSGVAFTGTLPVEVLMKSAPALIEISDALRISASLQLTGFDDHFQQHVSRRTGFLTGFHQLETDLPVAGDQRAVREDHVHFVSAVSDRRGGFPPAQCRYRHSRAGSW